MSNAAAPLYEVKGPPLSVPARDHTPLAPSSITHTPVDGMSDIEYAISTLGTADPGNIGHFLGDQFANRTYPKLITLPEMEQMAYESLHFLSIPAITAYAHWWLSPDFHRSPNLTDDEALALGKFVSRFITEYGCATVELLEMQMSDLFDMGEYDNMFALARLHPAYARYCIAHIVRLFLTKSCHIHFNVVEDVIAHAGL